MKLKSQTMIPIVWNKLKIRLLKSQTKNSYTGIELGQILTTQPFPEVVEILMKNKVIRFA